MAEFDTLLERARSVLNPQQLSDDAQCGTVSAALETAQGDVFVGICIDMRCSLGFCAERAAAATMLTQGQNVIVRMVADSHRGPILAPCGACREFIYKLSPLNLNAEVLVNETDVARLGDLMPYRWPD